jgi:RNA polymerase sigma factor (sigma-70 family)
LDEANATAAENLVSVAVGGDREALRALWHQHRRWVAAVLLAHKPRQAEVDDLLQEVAMAMVSRIGGLRDPAAFKPWLRAVAINAAKTAARRRPRGAAWLRLVGRGSPDADGPPDGVSADVSTTEEGTRVMALAQKLAEGYREPLLMKCVRGMSYRQIGQVLGMPETTVETRIARGRRMLRELVDATNGPRAEQENQIDADAGASVTARVQR